MKKELNILVIGAVNSTRQTALSLIKHDFKIVGILGYEPENPKKVSGLADLKKVSCDNNINYMGFQKINDPIHLQWAGERKPDIIFAVGFSQLLEDAWLIMPSLGCIGFHPTCLPEGRGRAPLAWSILDGRCASATFFLMGKEADNGPIFVQERFLINEQDDASNVESKVLKAIDKALNRWLPSLKDGIWNPQPQDEALATWYGKRVPDDGWINWHDSAFNIDRLIKASTHPHPGAFTFWNRQKLIVWSSEIEKDLPIKGVVGRVLLINESKGYLIQCGQGLLWIKEFADTASRSPRLNIGEKLGFYPEIEIYEIWKILDKLNASI